MASLGGDERPLEGALAEEEVVWSWESMPPGDCKVNSSAGWSLGTW